MVRSVRYTLLVVAAKLSILDADGNIHMLQQKASMTEVRDCSGVDCDVDKKETPAPPQAPTDGPTDPATAAPAPPGAKLNVLFLLCDDLNDDQTSGRPLAPELKKVGVSFMNNQANHPICAPSRASLLTGILGWTSGNIFFTPWYKNAVLNKSNTVMEHFKAHGYSTFGSGKLMHHELMDPADGHWDEYYKPTDYGPFAYDKSKYKLVPHPNLPEPFQAFGAIDLNFGRISQVPYGGTGGSGYVYKDRTPMYVNPNNYTDRDLMPDEINAEWAIKKIKTMAAEGISKPFFLGVGFTKPHTPMYCPDNYFEMFPEEDVPLPFAINSDESTPYWDITETSDKGYLHHEAVVTSYATPEIGLKKFRQAYHACRAFVSDLIDKVVLALKDSPFWKDTVVVVTSDNGWNDGAHKYVAKNAGWELAAAVPLIIRAPGFLEGTEVTHPTSLIDIYPTLVDFCNLSWDNRKSKEGAMLDGHSLRAFMTSEVDGPSVWTGPEGAASLSYTDVNKIELADYCKNDATCHHWSVRTLHMRYILYNNGQEEMYNETVDKGEKNNLADNDDYAETKAFARVALQKSSKIKIEQLGTWKEPKFCEKYCAGNTAAWSSKCGWEDCIDCPDCAPEEGSAQ